MSTKKMEKGGEVVTEARLAVLLSRFAQAADASLNLKMGEHSESLAARLDMAMDERMEQMREEILSELRLGANATNTTPEEQAKQYGASATNSPTGLVAAMNGDDYIGLPTAAELHQHHDMTLKEPE
jgi:hypothetical protein